MVFGVVSVLVGGTAVGQAVGVVGVGDHIDDAATGGAPGLAGAAVGGVIDEGRDRAVVVGGASEPVGGVVGEGGGVVVRVGGDTLQLTDQNCSRGGRGGFAGHRKETMPAAPAS